MILDDVQNRVCPSRHRQTRCARIASRRSLDSAASLGMTDVRGQARKRFGGLSCLSPPAVPTSTTATPHPEAVGPACFSLRAPEEARIIQPESLNQAPPRAISFILSRHIPNGSPSPPRVPPGPSNNPRRHPHQIKDMLHMIVNRPLPACGFASSAAGEGPFLSAPRREALPMRMKPRPPPLLRHRDAHPLRHAGLEYQSIRTFHQPPLRVSGLVSPRVGTRRLSRTSGIGHRRDAHRQFPPAPLGTHRADARVCTARRNHRPPKVHSPHPTQLPRQNSRSRT